MTQQTTVARWQLDMEYSVSRAVPVIQEFLAAESAMDPKRWAKARCDLSLVLEELEACRDGLRHARKEAQKRSLFGLREEQR